MSAAAAPEPTEPDPDPELTGPARIPIDHTARIDSLETRTGALEAQHLWLRIEQMEAELARQAKLIDSIVESIVEYVMVKSGGAAE